MLERRDTPGNLQRAMVAFKEALRLDARFVDAHAALARPTGSSTTRPASRSTSRRRCRPAGTPGAVARNAAVRLALGVTLTRGGRNAEAVQELQRALAGGPTTTRPDAISGRRWLRLGRVDEAVAEWRKALVLRPNNWQALSDMGRALFLATPTTPPRPPIASSSRCSPTTSSATRCSAP